jgi:RES domain-containing protein
MTPATIGHQHVPLYRVVRRNWADPLDTSYSQRPSANNRWNTPEFPALYCGCSERVARAVARDIFRLAAVEIADLQDAALPELVEIDWIGDLVDVASAAGVVAAGFPHDYPVGVDKAQTRAASTAWHDDGASGVLSRSASLMRQGLAEWKGEHEAWSETAVFVENAARKPRVITRHSGLDWLRPDATG